MKRTYAALILTCLVASPMSAGVVFEIETTDHDQSPPKTATTEVSAEGKNLKMGITASGNSQEGEMIYRGDRREMVVVDHDDKSYMIFDEATIRRIGGVANQAMKQMEEALKNVPEDRRAMIEGMMKQRMGDGAPSTRPATEVRRTNEKASKNGYPCVKYTVHRGDRKIRELWVTEWSNIESAEQARGAFEDMADFFQQLLDALPQVPGGGVFPGGNAGGNILAEMKDLNGFPVVTRDFAEDGSLEGESTLRSSRRRTLDPAEFEPPSGYKRRSIPGGA